MCKPFGQEELALILCREFHCHVMTIGGAATTNVDCDIQHTSFHDTHKFGLREWWQLEMQTPHHTEMRARFVILHKPYINTGFLGEVTFVVTFEEVASVVAKHSRFDYKHTVYFSLHYSHLR